jgi:mono/diheme cytochrome c family protein
LRRCGALLTATACTLLASSAGASEPATAIGAPQQAYLLACGGCHGIDGASNGRRVPTLKGLVGYYLNIPQGRAYLARLPNIAFADLDDVSLAALLNYVVFDLGGDSVPPHAAPFAALEVGRLRGQPLTEVSLVGYREALVSTLIRQYRAPPALREYSEQQYPSVQ